MQIIVSNRNQVSKVVQELQNQNSLFSVISITDPESEDVSFPREITKLRLKFHDVDEKCPSGNSIIHFDETMAKRVVQFVKDCELTTDVLVVHCEAGISRSAGLAGAISKFLNGNDKKFFQTSYIPNRMVYRLTLKEFLGNENFQIPNRDPLF